jgi:hypothetical protein
MSDNTINSTTQEYLDVYDITNDMVILKDGVVSIIMQIGTMNFSLLAEQEQDAIMYTYGALLNSLNFPIQINVQSNIKDASRYLRLLDNQIKKSKSRAKSQLIGEYRDFVANLIRERNVLEKKFFVVIPTNAAEMGLYTAESVLPGKTKFDISKFEKTVLMEKAATVLDPRRDHLISQFNRIGLFARQLDTQEIIQNFYINYNPESMEGQEVTNSESYTTPMVRASISSEQNLDKIRQEFKQSISDQPIQNEQAIQNNQPIQKENQEVVDIRQKDTKTEEIQKEPEPKNVETNVEINNKDFRHQAKENQSQNQNPPNMPNFSEEIISLQSNPVSEKPSSNQDNNDFALKLNQVPSPVELKIADSQSNSPKTETARTQTAELKIPTTPSIGQNTQSIETQNNQNAEDPTINENLRQKTINNKPNIAEL